MNNNITYLKKNYFIIVFNFSFFIINIIFLSNKFIKHHLFFKNADEYLFFKQKKSSCDYNFSDKITKEKKNISLMCTDYPDNLGCNLNFKRILENEFNYIVNINNENPDFLIYNVFGCEHSKDIYNNSVKVAIYSENIIPDFSEEDYAISQAHITFLDRYYKYPSFIWDLNKFKNNKVKTINTFLKNNKKTKFCAAVITNIKSYSLFRYEFIKKLNKYKHVDMGGSLLNDVGGKVKNKIKFLSSYKFSISMENSNGDGYVSEKIIDSLLAGAIPIYYGDYLIDEYINPKVYILVKGEKDISDKIEYIKQIDNNEALYNSIINEKIFINENYADIMKKVEDEKRIFLFNIFFQNKDKAKRIDDINSKYNCAI